MEDRPHIACLSWSRAAPHTTIACRVGRGDRSPCRRRDRARANDRRRTACRHHRRGRRRSIPTATVRRTSTSSADRLMRDALRTAPVAAVLSEEVELPEMLDADCAALRRDRSARRLGQSREQHLGRDDLLDPAESGRDMHLDLLRARHGAMRGRLLHLWSADDSGARARRRVDFFMLDPATASSS